MTGLPFKQNILKGKGFGVELGFARRQTPESRFSHYSGPDSGLVQMARMVLAIGKQDPGYRDGVVLCPVDPRDFYTSIVTLDEDDELHGRFEKRAEGEEPRKSISASRNILTAKQPAKFVDLVLYHRDVLAENGENMTNADWEIVSINASPTRERVPMHPDTLIANHFGFSGGTATGMSDVEFVDALRESAEFWKDKALAEAIE